MKKLMIICIGLLMALPYLGNAQTLNPGPIFVKNGGSLGLTVTNQAITNGTQIILHAGVNNWKMLSDGGIVLKDNPRFGLTVTNQNISNGTKIILHEGYNRWKLLSDGSIVLKDNPRFGLTIPNQEMHSGTGIILHEGYNQWGNAVLGVKVSTIEPGPLFVKDGGSLGLTVTGQFITNGTQIILHAGVNNWKMLSDGGIVLANNPKFGLTVAGQNISNGTKIILHEGYNRWKLLSDGSIVLKDNPRFGLTIPNQKMRSGTAIILHEGYNQWGKTSTSLKMQPEQGFRVIVNGVQCLDCSDGATSDCEPYIEYWVDGQKMGVLGKKKMQKSNNKLSKWERFKNIRYWIEEAKKEFWLTPGSVYAKNEVVFKMWEADEGGQSNNKFRDNDDFIGEVKINQSNPDGNFIENTFTGSGKWRIVCTKLTRKSVDPKFIEVPNRVKVRVPVLNQGREGACVAFSTVAALTTIYLNKTKPGDSKEELFDPMWLYNQRGYSTAGWNFSAALNKLKTVGIPFKNDPGKVLKVTKYRTISDKNEMRQLLMAGKPLLADFDVYNDFHAYAGESGVYGGIVSKEHAQTESGLPAGHAIVVIGYMYPDVESNDFPHWIFQNSWAPDWGVNGLCRIAENVCSFDSEMYLIEDVVVENAKK